MKGSPNENEGSDDLSRSQKRKRVSSKTPCRAVLKETGPSFARQSSHKRVSSSEDDEMSTSSEERLRFAGRLAAVELTNFMCHGALAVEFDPDVNNCVYIGGANGSGKSALFAAINIGLGGRGSDNGRGNAVKEYIKTGCAGATIKIVLTNQGVNACPKYGEFVVIERSIHQSTSTYQIKSLDANRREIKTSAPCKLKSEVDRLVDRFNIHLSNPVFWMTQDRSRTFLTGLEPAKIYKMYIQATKLEDIKESLYRVACLLGSLGGMMDHVVRRLAVRIKELERLNEIVEMGQRVENERIEVAKLKWMLMFCDRRDAQMALTQLQEEIVALKANEEKIGTAQHENREKRKKILMGCEDLQNRIAAKAKEIDGMRHKQKQIEDMKCSISAKVNELKQECDRREREMRDMMKKKLTAEKRIVELKRSIERDDQLQMVKASQRELASLEEQFAYMQNTTDKRSMEKRLEELDGESKALKAELDRVHGDYESSRQRLEQSKRDLERYQATKADALNRFGQNTRKIIEAIGRSKHVFERAPKGPLGSFVSMHDPKWALPIEECIGLTRARSFLCHSSRDAIQLRRIFDQLRIPADYQPNIITSRFTGRKYANLVEPSGEWLTVLRAIKVDDADVSNMLVDGCHLEGILLLQTDREARQLMDVHPPHNAAKAYTLNGGQALSSSRGQYRFYAGRVGARAQGLFLSVSSADGRSEREMKETIIDIESRLPQLQELTRRKNEEYVTAAREFGALKGKYDKSEARLREMSANVKRAENTVQRLQMKMQETDDQTEIENLQESVDEFELKLGTIREEIAGLRKEMSAEEGGWSQREEKLERIKRELKSLLQDLGEIKGDLNENRTETTECDEEFERYVTKKHIIQEKIAAAYIDQVVKAKVVVEETAKLKVEKETAVQPAGVDDEPDLTNFQSTQSAKEEYTKRNNKIAESSLKCDPSINMNTICVLDAEIKKEKKALENLQGFIRKMSKMVTKYADSYPQLKKRTSQRVRSTFLDLLKNRGFKGDLRFDNEKKAIHIVIRKDRGEKGAQPDEDEDGGRSVKRAKIQKEMRDLKGLSGGERSYATACLVLSLWQVMDQPFRMLDEFDVFMDGFNRKIVMEMLLDMAVDRFAHNQFIFFTPQGIKELTAKEGLQVFEMPTIKR